MRPLLVLALLMSAGCYRVALAPDQRREIRTVIVSVGLDTQGRQPTKKRFLPVTSDATNLVEIVLALTRRRVAEAAGRLGWQVTEDPNVHVFSGTALLSDAWPEHLCSDVQTEVVLWVNVIPTWSRHATSASAGNLDVELVAYLLRCPGEVVLWRDRSVGRAAMELEGPGAVGPGLLTGAPQAAGRIPVLVKAESIERMISGLVDRLGVSMASE